jgi:2-amino-4-hydroxy-6-hydroxymethyldihydropteridine diphosphokinase
MQHCTLEHRNGTGRPQLAPQGKVLVGLGANSPGPWGTPRKTLRRALKALEAGGFTIERISELYETAAMGQPHQPPYFNAVILGTTTLPAQALLRVLKDIEARAGRRGGMPWGRRTLDLDILDYKGLRLNWAGPAKGIPYQRTRPLVLPHPEIGRRPFVLLPLLDVAPDWRHPVSKASAIELWRRVSKGGQGRVLKRVS